MNKSLLIFVSLIAAAVVGYVVYISYFAAKATVDVDGGAISNMEDTQLSEMPKTEEQKLDALDSMTPSADASAGTASDSEKEELLNSAAGSQRSDTIPAGDAEKIRLLESLKN